MNEPTGTERFKRLTKSEEAEACKWAREHTSENDLKNGANRHPVVRDEWCKMGLWNPTTNAPMRSVQDHAAHLTIFGQHFEHDTAFVMSNRQGLMRLKIAIERALDTEGTAKATGLSVPVDGEGYDVKVALVSEEDDCAPIFNQMAVPYTEDYAKEQRKDALYPADQWEGIDADKSLQAIMSVDSVLKNAEVELGAMSMAEERAGNNDCTITDESDYLYWIEDEAEIQEDLCHGALDADELYGRIAAASTYRAIATKLRCLGVNPRVPKKFESKE